MPEAPGYGSPLPSPPLPPDARDRVADLLSRCFAEDWITAEDLEARLERVYRAETAAELDAIVADLPTRLPAPAVAAVPAPGGEHQRIAALFSGQQQRVKGVVPRRLEVRGRLGYVELDLTRATFAPGVTVIDVRAFMGYVQIRFPGSVRVDCRGRALFGFFSLKGRGAPESGEPAPEVQVVGRAMFGFAECFTPRRELPESLGSRAPRFPEDGG